RIPRPWRGPRLCRWRATRSCWNDTPVEGSLRLRAEVQEGGHGPPVLRAPGHQVEVRGPPVLDQRRGAVPPDAAVELLQVPAAAFAGGDEGPFLGPLGLEAHDVRRVAAPAVRTGQTREAPAPAARVAGQSALAVLPDVGEARRRPAERAQPELPGAARQVGATPGQVPLQDRAQAG